MSYVYLVGNYGAESYGYNSFKVMIRETMLKRLCNVVKTSLNDANKLHNKTF